MSKATYTIDELRRGISLPTGESHTIVVERDLVLEIEWPAELVNEFPEDAAFSLSSSRGRTTKRIDEAKREGGFVTLSYQLRSPQEQVELVASCEGRAVTLWSGRQLATDQGILAAAHRLAGGKTDARLDDEPEIVVAAAEPDPASDDDVFDVSSHLA